MINVLPGPGRPPAGRAGRRETVTSWVDSDSDKRLKQVYCVSECGQHAVDESVRSAGTVSAREPSRHHNRAIPPWVNYCISVIVLLIYYFDNS